MNNYHIHLDFETIREIGQEGRNSKVYLSHDKQLDGEIVTKHIQKLPTVDVNSYFTEARLLYANDHNNIVKINYAGENDNQIILAMPFYKNGSLKKKISNGNSLTIREVVRYAMQFLSGLNHIHAKGLIHFDIKPDNILISDTNEAMLSDFGLAKHVDISGFADADSMYTRHVSPEQIKRLLQTIKNDIYQTGITIYRMVNGNDFFNLQIPKDKEIFKTNICAGKFPDRTLYIQHVPIKLRKIINKCIAPNPIERYDNVLQIINDLAKIDENLDWRYSEDKDARIWIKPKDNFEYKVCILNPTDDVYNVCVEKIYPTKKTNCNKYRSNNININDVNKKLKIIFADL